MQIIINMDKWWAPIIAAVFLLFTIIGVAATITFSGNPTGFVNSSGNATVWVGGNKGIVNATGDVFASEFYIRAGGNFTLVNSTGQKIGRIYTNDTHIIIGK